MPAAPARRVINQNENFRHRPHTEPNFPALPLPHHTPVWKMHEALRMRAAVRPPTVNLWRTIKALPRKRALLSTRHLCVSQKPQLSSGEIKRISQVVMSFSGSDTRKETIALPRDAHSSQLSRYRKKKTTPSPPQHNTIQHNSTKEFSPRGVS